MHLLLLVEGASPESWPILAAFIGLQTTITAPILGYIIKQNADLRAQIEKRIADKDETIVKHEREIVRLQERSDQFMEMAFEAVRGFNTAGDVAQDATNLAKIVTGRRGH